MDNGFTEVINFPFTAEESKSCFKIDNPLDVNKPFLRTNLKNSLLSNMLYNERRQKRFYKIFEISDVYNASEPMIMHKKIALIASGRVGNRYDVFSKKIDAKFMISTLKNIYNISHKDIIEIPRSTLNSRVNLRFISLSFILKIFQMIL